MNLLKNLSLVFYPNSCVCCDTSLESSELIICVECRHDLPFFENADFKNNALTNIFKGRINIEKTGSFLEFHKHGKTKSLIHQLKYKGNQEIGSFLGKWWGSQLFESKILKDIDYIIPVPLHKKKLRKRGYNQLTTFGNTLALELQTKYLENVLIRSNSTKTQTYKNRFERFLNTETKFELTDIKILENKHILLIDDVITTGATIESCCKELLKTNNIKISVLSVAFTV